MNILFFFGFFLLLPLTFSEEKAGEYHHPEIFLVNAQNLVKLRTVSTSDERMRALADALISEGRKALATEPSPLREIHYEGLLNTDPLRIRTVESLKTMQEEAAIYRAWQLTGDKEFALRSCKGIIAWANTYIPTGNDVNENKLVPLIIAFISLREFLTQTEQTAVETWLTKMAELHTNELPKTKRFTNRFTKRLRLIALIGKALNRQDLIEMAAKGVRDFVTKSLRTNGTSFDLEERDSLTYHCSALEAALDTIILVSDDPTKLYEWTSADGGSIKKSVEFVIPFANGEKQRKEWENTRVGLDRRRAEAGISTYKPGKLFDPAYALPMLRKAARIDSSLEPIAYPDISELTPDAGYDMIISKILFSKSEN